MEKDLKEMLNSLKELVEELSKTGGLEDKFKESMEEAINEPCKITIETTKNGVVKTGLTGRGLAILVTLAGAEKSILKEINCTDKEFDFIKDCIGSKKVSENE